MISKQQYHKKNILQVIPALNSGGVERGTLEVAHKLSLLGNNSFVMSSGGRMVPQLQQEGSNHLILNVASKNPITILLNAKRIANIIKQYNIDVIHARSRAPAWSCYLAAKMTNINFMTTFHGTYNFRSNVKKYYNSIMTKGVVVIAISEFIKKHIIEYYHCCEDKIYVIPRGVDHSKFSNNNSQDRIQQTRMQYHVPTSTPVLLLPARFTKWKGHLVLVDALAQIQEMNFYCLLVGDMMQNLHYINDIKNKIQAYGMNNKIRLFEHTLDIASVYSIADIVLSTSIEPEAFGRTVIEAQAAGKIVIGSNIGGTCETIIDGVTGFQVAPGDSKQLAAQIAQGLKMLNSSQAKIMTDNATKMVIKNFSLEQMLEKTMRVYDEVMSLS